MTRREKEIHKASISWKDEVIIVKEEKAFVAGAQWADKTMIEKACEWIIENMPHYVSKDYTYEVDMADDFRKAMEE